MTAPRSDALDFTPLPDEPAPEGKRGMIAWLHDNLFSSWLSTAVTIVMMLLIARAAIAFFDWAVVDAIWWLPGNTIADTQACRMPGVGACWALIAEKYRFILFGIYPYDEQWRPALCIAIFVAMYIASANRRWWGRRLVLLWLTALVAIGVLMHGGVAGLRIVTEDQWGGLPVTLILSTFGIVLAFPLAIVVALGRISTASPVLRLVCTLYVEIVRGIPLISVLFMASVMFPLFLPEGITVSKLLRAQMGIVLFIAAYLAETIRGGLQAVGEGQGEAADALGLTYWQKMFLIVLPQALTLVLPPIVSLCIAFFKATSLVTIIGIFDLLNAGQRSVGEPAWQGFGTEAYLFVAFIYFCFCFSMSRYGLALEKRLKRSR